MASNHLEDLVAEWYQFKGYYVRRNIPVGKRARGGYECEIDIIAFNPLRTHLVQIEPSLDTDSWAKREKRFTTKFQAGKKHIPKLFEGFTIPKEIEQVAVLLYASTVNHQSLGGGKIVLVKDLIVDIFKDIRPLRIATNAIPEIFPNLRTLQFASEFFENIKEGRK